MDTRDEHLAKTTNDEYTYTFDVVMDCDKVGDEKNVICKSSNKEILQFFSQPRNIDDIHNDELDIFGSFQCFECNGSFDKATQMQIHIRDHISQEYNHKSLVDESKPCSSLIVPDHCPNCSVDLTNLNEDDLYLHIESHYDHKSYGCVLCSESFIDMMGFHAHVKNHLISRMKEGIQEVNAEENGQTNENGINVLFKNASKQSDIDNSKDAWQMKGSLTNEKLSFTNQNKEIVLEITRENFIADVIRSSESNKIYDKFGTFVCPDCSVSCSGADHLERHIHSHIRERILTNTADSSDKFVKHITPGRKSMLQINSCPSCQKVFNKSQAITIIRHLQSHYKTKPFFCIICQSSYMFASLYKRHVKEHFENTRKGKELVRQHKKQKCPECHKYFSPDGMKQHIAVNSESEFQCIICCESFGHKCRLRTHHLQHIKKQEFVCPICNQKFGKMHHLKAHLGTHGSDRYSCEACGRDFSSTKTLGFHMDRNCRILCADKIHDYQCPHCSKRFPSSVNLKRHLTMQVCQKDKSTVKDDKWYPCEFCSKIFKRKLSLNTHLRMKHAVRSFNIDNACVCPTCGKQYKDKGGLRIHMRVHTGELPVKCNLCDKSFQTHTHLHRHKLRHFEPRHSCKTCGKKFYLQSKLNVHTRLHTGEKPYACQYCSKTFRQSKHLNDHERTHTGEKPHACHICEKRFIQRGDLKKHMRTHKYVRNNSTNKSSDIYVNGEVELVSSIIKQNCSEYVDQTGLEALSSAALYSAAINDKTIPLSAHFEIVSASYDTQDVANQQVYTVSPADIYKIVTAHNQNITTIELPTIQNTNSDNDISKHIISFIAPASK